MGHGEGAAALVEARTKWADPKQTLPMAVVGKRPPDSYAATLTPQTYRIWLLIARARLEMQTNDMIATRNETEVSVIERIVNSPTYLYFESEFRLAMGDASNLTSIQARLTAGTPKALDALEYWIEKRDPKLAGISVAASKAWLAAAGIDTERRRTTIVGVKATLSQKQSDRLIEALASRNGHAPRLVGSDSTED